MPDLLFRRSPRSGSGHRGDPGTRMQTRAREIEDEISRFCADSVNRITVSARNYIMSRVFELVNLCSDMRADAATERGAALALQGQLVDARREIAGLQRQVLVAERPPGWRHPRRPGGGSRSWSCACCACCWAWRPGGDGRHAYWSGCSWWSELRRSGPGGRAGRHSWCWAGWSCLTRWSCSWQGVRRQTRTRGVPDTGWSDGGAGTGRGPTIKDEH
ncbi:hypothetical protein MRX96_055774 [Rhipicephalus microplus]